MRKIIIAALLLFTSVIVSSAKETKEKTSEAEKFKYRSYSGGMLLHTGYLYSGDFSIYNGGLPAGTVGISGVPTGIGGQIKFGFGTERHQLRIGSEGHSTNLYYDKSGSYFHAGWGGLLVDYIHISKGRIHPFAGVTIGAGGAKNIVVTGGSLSDFETEPSVIRKYVFFAIVPFAGIEISVTKRLNIVVKADYMINAGKAHPDFASGPRLYAGFLFCK